MSEQQDTIVEIIKTVSGKRPAMFGIDESLFDSGILDSFALPELVAALERQFGITIPDRDLNADTFESVRKIARYLDSQP